MRTLVHRPVERVGVVDVEPDLVYDLDAEAAAAARRAAVAPVVPLTAGAWEHPIALVDPRGGLGVLVVEGYIVRDVVVAGKGCSALIGPGDIVHLAEAYEGLPSVPFESEWRVLEDARVALLDPRFTAAVSRWPSLVARLAARAARLTHVSAVHLAITCMTGIEPRLYMLFWHLADRFGHVDADGLVIPIRLTHRMLARLVRAERPSVTLATGALRERNLVDRRDDGSWLVVGHDPGEVLSGLLDRRAGGARA